MEELSRLEILIGDQAIEKLKKARVAIFGIGGVGGYVTEALARSGIGSLDLIDNDSVCLSNINRQIIATHKTVGELKVDVMKKRILDINPDINVETYDCFYLPSEKDKIDFSKYDYIVDAIDTVTAKLDLIKTAKELNIPIISAMGCGNRLDPTKIRISDIYKTSNDPLAKIMRKELKKLRINKLTVVYSLEDPIKPLVDSQTYLKQMNKEEKRRSIPGSSAFVPSAAGLAMASYIVKDLIGYN